MKIALGLVLACIPLIARADPPPLPSHAPNLDQMAGVYKHRFANGDVSGDSYTSEDVFEVVKLSSTTAYFRIHSEFFNGHICGLSGVADLEPDALTYHGPPDYQGHLCVLKFTANKEGVIVDDVDGYCRNESCGERGGYDYGTRVDYPFKARRTIRYMTLILKSSEYASALKEHEAAKPRRVSAAP